MAIALTAVIVDDEEAPRNLLLNLLGRRHPEVQLLGTADDVPSGIELIRRTAPQVLFLDIELKDRTGFDLLRSLGADCPHVIFTTAHESYAVQAIRFSALDYLLKPIDTSELSEAISKAEQAVRNERKPVMVDMLLKNIDRSIGDRVIALPVSDGLELVHVNEILVCESDSNYTTLHMRDEKRMVISRTLKEFEDLLGEQDFIRVHNSYLISKKHIRKYIKGEGGEAIMSNGMSVAVSRRKKQELMEALERL
ncbi:MAG TPA: LytTR family DNA-binding domain-containing protein [Flavobacteriales bacterium]|nr:LytTR family DNA-binding domain-containing protein [Flavobacteriales bacterium]HNU55178.1 LytTR family DNA-binding domain-containing protein [Flavobacteriales bacterium]